MSSHKAFVTLHNMGIEYAGETGEIIGVAAFDVSEVPGGVTERKVCLQIMFQNGDVGFLALEDTDYCSFHGEEKIVQRIVS